MKPKHLILAMLALLTSINASAEEWTDANGTVWNFTISGSDATLSRGNEVPCITGTIPTELTIPSIVYVGENAYAVTSVGYNAFSGCSGLISISLPESITTIGNYAFQNCSGLTSVTIPNSVTSIGSSAFYGCSGLTSVTIPNSVTSIGGSAFYGCSNLTNINIPDAVTYIGEWAFSGCSSLISINIPSNVTYIENGTFYGCSSLTTVNVPPTVTRIQDQAFYGCSSLTSIYIPKDVYIDALPFNEVFTGCTNLTFFHFGGSLPQAFFVWPSDAIFFVPDDAVNIYQTAWPDRVNRIVPESKLDYVYDIHVTAQEGLSSVIEAIGEENANLVVNLKVHGTINGYDVMAIRNKMINLMKLDLSDAHVVASSYHYFNELSTKDNTITGFFGAPCLQELKLPADIVSIEDNAFSGCKWLRTLDIPETITTIPNGAFSGCNYLYTLTLPKRLLTIGEKAFQDCIRLREIHLPPYLTAIGERAFNGCDNLNSIYAYMPNIIDIGTNTFNDYTSKLLYIPEFLYKNYYYDTNWSQFSNLIKTPLQPDDYDKVLTNNDIVFADGDERIPDNSDGTHVDGEVDPEGSFTVEGDTPQPFDNVDQHIDGEGHGGSLIGENDGENGNLSVNHLRVNIHVKPGRWYFFIFPYDVTIEDVEYPGQYAWLYYDAAHRALTGQTGWKTVEGETLHAFHGYAFQTGKQGTMVITFNNPTFGGDLLLDLVANAAENIQHANWNLVGNPNSCFYDFLEDAFSAPITRWNPSTGTYTAYRPGDDECHLQPYEAFFVQKPGNMDHIKFKDVCRESYRQSEAKKSEGQLARRRIGINPLRRIINLQLLCDEQEADRTRVVLNNEKSHAYELDCDAAKMMSGNAKAQLYSVENGIQMAINERPQEGDIRLGYTAKQAGRLRISATRMDLPMMLIDTQMGITFDLSLGTYDFDTAAGTFDNRFLLCLSGEASAINNLADKTGVCIGTQDGGIAIGGAEGKTITIYTTGGALASQRSGNGFIALKSGMYVVSVDGVSAKVSVK